MILWLNYITQGGVHKGAGGVQNPWRDKDESQEPSCALRTHG